MKFKPTPKKMWKKAISLTITDRASVKTGLLALIFGLCAGLAAGIFLGSFTDILLELPGLVVLAPAALGLRGNVFGALACRLSTMTRLGEVPFSRRLSSGVGQNLAAAISLSIFCSFVLAIMAKIVSEAFGIVDVISIFDFFLISIIGAIIPTLIVLFVTVFLAKLCVKKEWDLDNIAAPLVTATGDMVTIPSLVFATAFIKYGWFSNVLAVLVSLAAIVIFILSVYSKHIGLRRIVKESTPILLVGGLVSISAGLTVQGRLNSLSDLPIFLVLIPPLLSINGAIGAVFGSRISTKLHLGTIRTDKLSVRSISEDIVIAYSLALPVFFLLGLLASIFASIGHLNGPGAFTVIFVSVVSGIIATTFSNFIGYISAVLTYRFGLDPDNFAVPSVTSVSDLGGAIVLMATLGVFVL